MSEADVVPRVIARLVAGADEHQARILHELACSAGYLWPCANTDCSSYNYRGLRYCAGCGWGREGAPVGDITSSLYAVPKRRWSALRRAVTAHFAQFTAPMPDAVLFDYWGGSGWRGAKVSSMYGGRSEDIPGGFGDRDAHEDIAAALDGLTRFEKPTLGEHMRVVLSSS